MKTFLVSFARFQGQSVSDNREVDRTGYMRLRDLTGYTCYERSTKEDSVMMASISGSRMRKRELQRTNLSQVDDFTLLRR